MILSVTPLLKCLLSLIFFYYQPIFLINYKLLFSDSRLDMTLESSTKQKDQIKIFSKACDIIHIESYSNLPPMCFIKIGDVALLSNFKQTIKEFNAFKIKLTM